MGRAFALIHTHYSILFLGSETPFGSPGTGPSVRPSTGKYFCEGDGALQSKEVPVVEGEAACLPQVIHDTAPKKFTRRIG